MQSFVAIDAIAIMQMAFVAALVALLLPIEKMPTLAKLGELRLGLLRSFLGIGIAVSSWSTIQVVGGTFVDRAPQTIEVPIVLMPQNQMPGLPKQGERSI
jgi:hypothetical protein